MAMLAALVLGVFYLLIAKPLYTAKSSLLIDRDTSKVVDQLATIGGTIGSALDDDAMVLSQVELLKSDTIGLSVVDTLKLPDDPAFNAERRLSGRRGQVGGGLVSTRHWAYARQERPTGCGQQAPGCPGNAR